MGEGNTWRGPKIQELNASCISFYGKSFLVYKERESGEGWGLL
jgi:hypothetical protein